MCEDIFMSIDLHLKEKERNLNIWTSLLPGNTGILELLFVYYWWGNRWLLKVIPRTCSGKELKAGLFSYITLPLLTSFFPSSPSRLNLQRVKGYIFSRLWGSWYIKLSLLVPLSSDKSKDHSFISTSIIIGY